MMKKDKLNLINGVYALLILILAGILVSGKGIHIRLDNSGIDGTLYHENRRDFPYKDSIDIPLLPPNPDRHLFGSRIQRTMSLLATSNENNRNKIRILFYGQSIVQSIDTRSMVEFLRKEYPYADIEYENLAIGGFPAPELVRTAIHDLYPFYPDLLIFHVYGGEKSGDLERIIYNTRKYTTSDILLFNHHISWEADPEKLKKRTLDDDQSSECWNFLAQKYGCELADVRKSWKEYLETYPHIGINTLMGDTIRSNVHPNAKGNKLLEMILLEHLQPNPSLFYLPSPGWYQHVRDYEIKRFLEEKEDEVRFNGEVDEANEGVVLSQGELKFRFQGNKIVLNTIPSERNANVIVLIDDKPPSEHPELYYATRPTKAFSHWRPALKRVTPGGKPSVEEWTLTLTRINRETELIDFELHGSQTGFDGRGSNQKDFISNSGKI
jgi:hypothetical protein